MNSVVILDMFLFQERSGDVQLDDEPGVAVPEHVLLQQRRPLLVRGPRRPGRDLRLRRQGPGIHGFLFFICHRMI